MKLSRNPIGSKAGGTLAATMVITFVIGATLASYLTLVQNQANANHRSQLWNESLTVAEAGVEDAMQFINKYARDSYRLHEWSLSTSVTEDYWNGPTNGCYWIERSLGSDAKYWVVVSNRPWGPIITSTGRVLNKRAYNPLAPNGGPNYTTEPMDRVVRVETTTDSLFPMAMVADRGIDLMGNNIMTDSFDSGDPSYSTGGRYDPAKHKANGDVASNMDIVNSINVGNAKIMGSVSTGPGGTVSIGPNGSVGDLAWVSGGNVGIQTGYVTDDMNVRFETVADPAALWLPIPSGRTINGKTYSHVIDVSGDYQASTLTGSVYVNSNVTARIRVTGIVELTGSGDEIRLSPDNSAVRFYMSGPSFKLRGNGVVNQTGLAENFIYYGLPSNTLIEFGGNGEFVGAIYAPQADFYLGGGGKNYLDFIGASVTKSVYMNGHFRFHYDEALARLNSTRGYLPVSWAELN